jgi:hypothetical protein
MKEKDDAILGDGEERGETELSDLLLSFWITRPMIERVLPLLWTLPRRLDGIGVAGGVCSNGRVLRSEIGICGTFEERGGISFLSNAWAISSKESETPKQVPALRASAVLATLFAEEEKGLLLFPIVSFPYRHSNAQWCGSHRMCSVELSSCRVETIF